MAKLPAFQFYPGDWRKDTGVQSLSYHNRGIWFEMLCLMHESSERGVLILNGHPLQDDAIARLLGLDLHALREALTTLLTLGIASRRESDGAIYCRRMVRDEEHRIACKNAGKLGGNPKLVNLKVNPPLNHEDKRKPTPSSSSSSSSSDFSPPNPPSREERELIQAIGKCTGADPKLAANAGRFLEVARDLIRAGYSVSDVDLFAVDWRKYCPGSDAKTRKRPTVNELSKHIGAVRIDMASRDPPPIMSEAVARDRILKGLPVSDLVRKTYNLPCVAETGT